MPEDRLWGWLGPLLVTAFGAFLRFNRLRVPKALIFDETYYAKDAWSILNHGVELKLLDAKIANPLIVAGHTNFFAPCDHTSACGEYVVQPEIGKLLIAVGEWLFGLNPFGWRFASAVFGSLAILLICRIARRMTRSTLLGCVAGLLMRFMPQPERCMSRPVSTTVPGSGSSASASPAWSMRLGRMPS